MAQNYRRQMVDHFSMPGVARQFIRKHFFSSIISTLTSDVPWPLRGACDSRRHGLPEVLINTSNNLMSRDVVFPSAPSKMSSVTIYVASRLNSHSSPSSRLTFHFIRCFFVKIQTGFFPTATCNGFIVLDRNLLPGEAMATMSQSQSAVCRCSILNGLSCEFGAHEVH